MYSHSKKIFLFFLLHNMVFCRAFVVSGFFGMGETSIRSTVITGQTEGLKEAYEAKKIKIFWFAM